jgi:amidase
MLLTLGAPGAVQAQGEPPESPPAPLRALDVGPFEEALMGLTPQRRAELDDFVIEASIAELGAAMAFGETTSVELTTYYLARIEDLDIGGLQSMNELNPEALEIAAALDAERAAGDARGPLHGIPISIKDNIGSGDQMHNTAGAAALADARSDRDAFVTARLREAGAVIIGKANLSEWAGFMQIPGQPPGFSALGGQVANPYDVELSPSGSSAGPAVGTSANLVAASIGTETLGSLIAPASANGVVGVKPSLGLVSRDRVIPITDQTDTPGVLARRVADAAILLAVIAGVDPADPVTEVAAEVDVSSLAESLDENALRGKRVGFHTGAAEVPDGMSIEEFIEFIGFSEALAGLEAAGAEVVLIWGEPLENTQSFVGLGVAGLARGVAAYLADTDPSGEIANMADVVAFNAQDAKRYAPYDQNILEAAAAMAELSQDDYEAAGSQLRAEARAYLDGLVAEHEVDVLASRDNRLSSAYAVAGYPAVAVPAGTSPHSGGPIGLTFVGDYLEDPELLDYAYAFEQATSFRQAPSLD